MKSKETDDQIETRRLKTENRLLLQRVDILEVENQNLADKLIQVNRKMNKDTYSSSFLLGSFKSSNRC